MAIDPTVSAKAAEAMAEGREGRIRERALLLAVRSSPGESAVAVTQRAAEYADYLRGPEKADG